MEQVFKSLSTLPQGHFNLSGLGSLDHWRSAYSVALITPTCLSQFGAGRCTFGLNLTLGSLSSTYEDLVCRYSTLVSDADQPEVFDGPAKGIIVSRFRSSAMLHLKFRVQILQLLRRQPFHRVSERHRPNPSLPRNLPVICVDKDAL